MPRLPQLRSNLIAPPFRTRLLRSSPPLRERPIRIAALAGDRGRLLKSARSQTNPVTTPAQLKGTKGHAPIG